MARHRKPSRRRLRSVAIVAGAAASVPLTQGTAVADPPWNVIIQCESSGNPKAQNPTSTASGLFSFIDSTWAEYGGRQWGRHAKDASPEQQYIVANRTFAADGLSPWDASKHCWGPKVGHVMPAHATTSKAPSRTAMYTVRPGDSLSSVAAAHGSTWQALYQANRNKVRNPALILPGLQLNLP